MTRYHPYHLLLLTCLLTAPSFPAAPVFKANNTVNLNQATSWVTNGPPTASDTATYDATVSVANTSALGDNLQSWQGLSVTGAIGGNVIISIGNTLTLGSDGLLHNPTTATHTLTLNCGITLGATQSWTIASGRTATASTNITGTASLTKDGGGILVLGGANTFNGGLFLNQGTLTISTDANLGDITIPLTVTGSSSLLATGFTTSRDILIQSGATLTNSVNVLLTLNGTISGAGSLRKTDTGILVLNGTNTHATTVIAAGELRANENAGMSPGNLNILGGGIWASSTNITRALGTGAGQVQLTGDGGFSAFGAPIEVNFGGAGDSVNWAVAPFGTPNPFYLNNVNATNKLTFRNNINLNGTARTITVNANVVEISGIISNGTGTAGFTKAGAGVLWLTATNTFNGTLTVNGAGGTLRARDGIGIPAAINLTLTQDGIWESDENIVRPVGSGAGQIQLTGAGAGDGFSAFGSPISVNLGGAGASLTWGSATFVPPALVLNETSATHPITFANGLDLNGGTRTVRANSTNFAGTITGVISHDSGSSVLTKSGPGTIILAATNTWAHSQEWGTNLNITAGFIQIDREENLGSTPIQFQARSLLINGGTLRAAASFSIDDTNRGITLGASDGWFDVPAATTLSLAVPIAGATGDLRKTGDGTLVLASTANTYGTATVGTHIEQGTLDINHDGNLGTASADLFFDADTALRARATATLNSGRAITIAAGSTATFDITNSVELTLAGVIATGTGALTKTGDGTLTFSAINLYDGLTTISNGAIRAGVANAFGLGMDGDILITPAGTLDAGGFNIAPDGLLLGSGTVDNTVAASVTLTVGGAGASATFDGIIQNTAGTLGISKLGAGTWTLTNPGNSYSGTTTVDAGTLLLGAAGVIPNGAGKGNVSLTGAGDTLDLNGFNETINGLAGLGLVTNSGATATLTLGDNDATASFTGVVGGPLALTKIGAGTQTFAGISTYIGDTTVSNGTLRIGVANALPDGTGRGNVVVASGATLDAAFADTINGLSGAGLVNNSTATARILTVGANDQSSEFSGAITNSGGPISLAITKIGTGTLTLSGTNGYGGATVISAGTLQIGSGGPSGSLGTGATTDNSALVFNRSDTLAYNAIISGTGTVTKTGPGTLVLGAASTYTGLTTIDTGTLKFNILNALPSGTTVANVQLQPAATLDMAGFSGTIGTLLGAGTVDNTTGVPTNTLSIGNNGLSGAFNGLIQNTAGALAVTKVGAGTWTLDGTNTFSGNLTVNAGTVLLGGVNSYSGHTIVGNGLLRLLAANAIPNGAGKGNVDVQTSSARILDLNGFSETINGLLGPGTVTNASPTPVTLTLGDADASTSYSGAIGDLGTLTLTKVGTGIQTVSGANTYSGNTIINNGVLRTASAGSIPDGPGKGNVSVAPGATFDSTFSETINGLSGAGIVNNSTATARVLSVGANDQTSEFSGMITNSGGPISLAITKIGAGTLTLSGNNGYGGVTTVNTGTLKIGNGATTGTLGTGNTTDNSALLIDRDGTYTYSAIISGTGTVTKTGPGTFTLAGVNTYSGLTTVNGGTLQIATNERIANTSPLTISGGTFDLQTFNESVSNVTLVAGSIVGSGGTLTGSVYNVESGTISARLGGAATMTKATTGTVTVTAANAYTGTTTINNGTLLVNNASGSGTGSGSVTVNSSGTLGGTGTISGAVTVNSSGTLAPGSSVGTLTVGSMSLASGAAVAIELNGVNNDKLVVSNTNGLTIASSVSVSLYTEGGITPWTTDGTYDLFQYTGTLGGTGLAGLSVANPQPGKTYGFRTSGGWIQLVITDSDFPLLSLSNTGLLEGNAGTTSLVFPIAMSSTSSTEIVVNFATSDGTAKSANNDYLATNGTLHIPAGNASAQITVDIVGDTSYELNETFTLTLSSPTHATLFTPAATGTITNDDAFAGILYVDDTATGNNNGFNWFDAYTNLQSALNTVTAGQQIWVAGGTYLPTNSAVTSSHFLLRANVTMYGGFAGNESTPTARDFVNTPTASILSGDIGTPGADGDNCQRVVLASSATGAVFDGFSVRKAFGTQQGAGMRIEGAPITVRNSIFEYNRGNEAGALHNNQNSTIDSCIFRNNSSASRGGAIQNYSPGTPTYLNCLFYDNHCDTYGGAMSVYHVPINFVNCSFIGNTSSSEGQCAYVSNYGVPTFMNCILWDAGDHGGGIYDKPFNGSNESGAISLINCDINGGMTLDLNHQGTIQDNIATDPLFENEGGRDLHLQQTSPCKDTGTPNSAPAHDLEGNPRPNGAGFDMGAYEFGSSTPPTGLIILVR